MSRCRGRDCGLEPTSRVILGCKCYDLGKGGDADHPRKRLIYGVSNLYHERKVGFKCKMKVYEELSRSRVFTSNKRVLREYKSFNSSLLLYPSLSSPLKDQITF